MTRNKKSWKQPKWSFYPSLHDDVSRLLEQEDLYFDFYGVNDKSCLREYDTNIMGRFPCRNRACGSDGWSSKRIPITIRMYAGAKYNARVYHQSCKACGKSSKPILDDSYAERVAYRIKKWNGVEMEHPAYFGKGKGPHLKELCEGCKDGHCSEI